MAHRIAILLALTIVAQAELPPGYVDPEPVLLAAAKAIGTDNLKCVTIGGTGYAGAVGQQKESGWNIDWPRGEALANLYPHNELGSRNIEGGVQSQARSNPASWKYGTGWKGGTPLQQHSRQTFAVNGKHALAHRWHRRESPCHASG